MYYIQVGPSFIWERKTLYKLLSQPPRCLFFGSLTFNSEESWNIN